LREAKFERERGDKAAGGWSKKRLNGNSVIWTVSPATTRVSIKRSGYSAIHKLVKALYVRKNFAHAWWQLGDFRDQYEDKSLDDGLKFCPLTMCLLRNFL
jgi:hypothetical protein